MVQTLTSEVTKPYCTTELFTTVKSFTGQAGEEEEVK
jgi:hypothetical protein